MMTLKVNKDEKHLILLNVSMIYHYTMYNGFIIQRRVFGCTGMPINFVSKTLLGLLGKTQILFIKDFLNHKCACFLKMAQWVINWE